ncbi:MAG: sulfite exporter TauE/SafE family protein [Atopobiaceae bacterium]|nr:sulfite exporter TauE/SafE family protein [Atopobiaceae bacterium]
MDYLLTFLEGIITFISPCLLPMLPLYLAYCAGNSAARTSGGRAALYGALGFVVGFSAVFCAMGAFAGFLGSWLLRYGRVLDVVCGIVIIFMGLGYLGVIRLPSLCGASAAPAAEGGFVRSIAFGVVFALSWTPCVGAFLASALSLAASSGSATHGIALLLCYSLGLGLPFAASAILIDQLGGAFAWIKQHYAMIERLSGALLIAMGVLMATGAYGTLLRLLAP